MIKQILKIIWAQRRSNGWLFGELVVVMCALWFMIDKMWVDLRCYYSPLGYDITNTWRFKLATLTPNTPGYLPDSLNEHGGASDLLALMERIRREPEVEGCCATYWSMPYSPGNSWSPLYPVDGDTTASAGQLFHILKVTPEYFDLFRVKDKEGRAVTPLVREGLRPVVITAEGERAFFPGGSAVGKQISYDEDLSDPYTVRAVLPAFRSNDYERQENCSFAVMTESMLDEYVHAFSVSSAELSVRMKRGMTKDEMYHFLEGASERMQAGNLYVYGVTPISEMRALQLSGKEMANSQKLSMMAFLLANVFFGIVGTFWLRTERRRGEIGLRMAVGSSRRGLAAWMYGEGLCLLALTLPFLLLFAANMAILDKLDSYREPLSLLRFGATLCIAYLLMAGMICLGIFYPVRKATRLAPAEALRYE